VLDARGGVGVAGPRSGRQSALVLMVAPLLFLSGAAGLVYQVAWVRLLGLAFGVTMYAVSTVLAAFMGGLAIGSIVGGRRADSTRRPLRVYGLVELGVGLSALLTPWAFDLLQSVYAGLAQVVDPARAPLVAGGARAVLAFAVLLIPTALMGATLPLAVQGVRNAVREIDATRGDAWTMGLLYATNTAGAIVGCLGSGFILIGRFGLAETIGVAAAANTLAGLGGLWLGRPAANTPQSSQTPDTDPWDSSARPALTPSTDPWDSAAHPDGDPKTAATLDRRPPDGDPHAGPDRRLARAALWAFAASGCISLAYEVVWSRILAVLFDSSIYGFVLMLATVLLGIAVGGALGGLLVRWRPRARLAGTTLGWLELGIGVAAVLALVAFGGAFTLLSAVRADGPVWLMRFVRTDLRLMAALCVLTVLPAALLMGATFPVAARLWAAGEGGLGRRLGDVYAGNVAGAIIGALLGGFVLVPLLGAHASLLVLAGANIVVGALVLNAAGHLRLAAIGGILAFGAVVWGATRPPLVQVVFHEHFPDQQLLAYWEGLENTVSVGRDADGTQTLFTNSRGQTNDAPDLVRYHRVMGHLAALLAPTPTPRALVVGLGAGTTPGALAQHGGAQVDVVELSPSIISAAPFFHLANADVLEQPNVHVTIDDGRNYLLRNRQPYDVITADVVHPYDVGATNLYSVEYFRLAAKSLTPNGIMLQWVSPGSAFEHALIVRTFLQAFPNATLWLGGDLLIGSPEPLRLSRSGLDARLADPSARASLAEVGFNHPQDVLAQFRGTSAELQTYAATGPILTDDHPILEYFENLDIAPDPPDLSQFKGGAPVVD
jgi:spermidine synthase